MSPKAKQLKFRPYARLLTMLGDQLIKNERVALVELVKNAYDADASWVKVIFEGFDADFQGTASSRIIIEDDGIGMTRDVIENHWANPATPQKLIGKKTQRKTKKGRIIQGEKGIGRFALLKIGRDITITTRPARLDTEFVLKLDVSKYDENFLDDDDKGMFLDAISMSLSEQSPAEVIRRQKIELGVTTATRRAQGTRIEIGHLSGSWSHTKVTNVYEDLARVQSLFDLDVDDPEEERGESEAKIVRSERDPFELLIYRGAKHEPLGEEHKQKLSRLLRHNTVFTIEGSFSAVTRSFDFTMNGIEHSLKLDDPAVMALPVFKDHFGKAGALLQHRDVECGPFAFRFYVFDFSNQAAGQHHLDEDEKVLIKGHRIYLYRDGIRVYPYGDPDDDWLQIDMRRGTVRASEFMSNDQVVGVVDISQENNPRLSDKTSREGLVEVGNATTDFRVLLQSLLAWIRKDPYNKYRQNLSTKDDMRIYKAEAVQRSLDEAVAATASGDLDETGAKLRKATQDYKAERRYLVQRAETTEHLAGVGLSVETASHDLMLAMGSAIRQLNGLMQQTHRAREIDPQMLQQELALIQGLLTFIEAQMKDMQLLFRSTKQRRKALRVAEILAKVQRLFGSLMSRLDIEYEVTEEGPPLVAHTTEAVLLQTLMNLFDNSVHWLELHAQPRRIHMHLDGEKQQLVFSDNGPGIVEADRPYLFEPFFSGKGEEGRGLGLYIARQLLDRHGYTIDVSDKTDALESGANFTVSFIKE